MDVFSAIVSGVQVIYQFIESYSSATDRSRSLAARLKWDLEVLSQFTKYYNDHLQSHRANPSGGSGLPGLSSDQAKLLDESASYLLNLAEKVTAIASKLQARTSRRWSKELNKALWWHREGDLAQLEAEVFEWTKRLDLHLVGLPAEVKTAINLAGSVQPQANSQTPNFSASLRIQQLTGVTARARSAQDDSHSSGDIYRDSKDVPAALLASPSSSAPSSRFHVANVGAQTLLVETRPHFYGQKSRAFRELEGSLTRLVRALHCLDGTTISILQAQFLYHEPTPAGSFDDSSFKIVSSLPFAPAPTMTGLDICPSLADLISVTVSTSRGTVRAPAQHPLEQRLQLARSLASAVFFIHGVGFLHHNISSHNIVLITRPSTSHTKMFPRALGIPFLVGFGAVREASGMSEDAPVATKDDLYQHPDRVWPKGWRPKYNAVHEVYSLGLVLLEIGLWKSLERSKKNILNDDPGIRSKELEELLEIVGIIAGTKYRRVVSWCLGLTGDNTGDTLQFSREVLENLEDLAGALT